MNEVLLLSAVTACISFTLAEAALFSGFRRLALRAHPKLGELTQCAYCTSHWVALTLVLCLRPGPGWGSDCPAAISLPLTVFLVVWLATPQWLVISRLMAWAGK
jgi:hypothetical protein